MSAKFVKRRKMMDDGGELDDSIPKLTSPDIAKDFGAAPTNVPATTSVNYAPVGDIGYNPGSGPSTWDRIASGANRIAPFASNIANSFRTPPMPIQPQLLRPVTLSRINLGATRQAITNSTRAADVQADRGLDEQSAQAIRSRNLAGKLNQLGQVNEQEEFLNARQKAEAAGMNINVDMANSNSMNRYNDQLVERQVAQQREQSANFANASNKAIEIGNEKDKARLDRDKLDMLSRQWKASGVYTRMKNQFAKEGNEDPTDIDRFLNNHAYGGRMKVFADGGVVPPIPGAGASQPITAGQTPANDDLNALDMLTYAIGKGVNPLTTKQGRILAQTNPVGQKLITSAMIFNQDPQFKQMNPQERVHAYFASTDQDADVHAYKNRLNLYHPDTNMRDTPDVDVQSLASKAFGGYNTSAGRGYLNPMGNSRSIGMGPGIPHGTVRRNARMSTSILADGGNIYSNYGSGMMNTGRVKFKNVNFYSPTTQPTNDYDYGQLNNTLLGMQDPRFSGVRTLSHGGVIDRSMHNKKVWNEANNNPNPYIAPNRAPGGQPIMKDGGWIGKAVNPEHKGYCTPMTKATCTPRRKAFAMTMKKHHGFH